MHTIKIKPSHPSQGEHVVINREDFDPAKGHELHHEEDPSAVLGSPQQGVSQDTSKVEALEAEVNALRAQLASRQHVPGEDRDIDRSDPDSVKKASVAQLRAELEVKGLTVPEGAKKAELVALLANS